MKFDDTRQQKGEQGDYQASAVVGTWRSLRKENEALNKSNDELAKELEQRQQSLEQIRLAWRHQEIEISEMIRTTMETVETKRAELRAVENDANMIALKVKDRQDQIDKKRRIIEAREKECDAALDQLEKEEQRMMMKVKEFRDARDVCHHKLLTDCQHLESLLPAEEKEHSTRIGMLTDTLRRIEQTIIEERHEWEVQTAKNERKEALRAKALLNEEICASTEATEQWSAVMTDIGDQSSRLNGIAQELSRIRQQLGRKV